MIIHEDIRKAFPGIFVFEGDIGPLSLTDKNPHLEQLKEEVITETKNRFTLEQVKDDPLFRAYRDFFWSVGVDPTKTRPASEALVRRILAGKPLPSINTAVDAYNLASVRTGVPIGAFDADLLVGEITMRFAQEGEKFLGIGMERPLTLQRNQVILTDENEIIAVYPYRDSDGTKITQDTKKIHIVSCGVPKIEPQTVMAAYELAAEYLKEYNAGR
ncbi:MAG TPA: phenylalanine--tRNA ligase beta subunit-related protein [Methanospirillum sp.]|uniref:B3/B4 domain-containing protein n=1 Tax=Methanospirillum sp. TaxID=45200 RepID=UPI002B8A25FE|nr:phenylalanine--tRNA ligase beta subunit-related protein [Methanospirillum sp.]HOJ96408.1 phenylalanine--tRNA ligase beta subunit-related protein [Methanospirillum sp.]HOL42413.1 phenylalanine--tRNA ligase beta subunit-related protein [Methanospirillum sp.]HPP78968.1 phenylalanine--tRNA ligase beta subunit-related protein [Methanospirillum sp.]